jgi:hypothetical protein
MQLRERLGVWIKDRWRYERALRSPGRHYLSLANRNESLEPGPEGIGFSCCWRFTSRLHAPSLQPKLAVRLLQRCLADAPIQRRTEPTTASDPPEVSVLIGHRGTERLPLLLATLESLAAQQDVRYECLVIEQDSTSQIASSLPGWVRHVLAPPLPGKEGYNRSKAFNDGAKLARSSVILLHDNDMLVPTGYLQRILQKIEMGYAVINPKRYIFYLTQEHSNAVIAGEAGMDAQPAEAIVQNLEAGGSMAITREVYWSIGGMDESFQGWGGEDTEFWDRCQVLPCWRWGYEPIVHLWHQSQPLKVAVDKINVNLAHAKIRLPRQQRIDDLKAGMSS